MTFYYQQALKGENWEEIRENFIEAHIKSRKTILGMKSSEFLLYC